MTSGPFMCFQFLCGHDEQQVILTLIQYEGKGQGSSVAILSVADDFCHFHNSMTLLSHAQILSLLHFSQFDFYCNTFAMTYSHHRSGDLQCNIAIINFI